MSWNLRYTTGQTSGFSGLSYQTIYRYVRRFGEFFSPQVAQKKRGRRWSDEDLVTLLSIQTLYARRSGDDSIREMLKDGWRIDKNPASHPETLEAFSMVFEACQIYAEQAKKDRAAAHELVLKLNAVQKKMVDDHDLVMHLLKAVKNQAQDIAVLATRKTSFISIGRQ